MKREFAWGTGDLVMRTDDIRLAEYKADLEHLSLNQIALLICDDMRCPIDWSKKAVMRPVEQIMQRRWYFVLSDELRHSEIGLDANLLQDYDTFLSQPSDHPSWDEIFSPLHSSNATVIAAAKELASNLFLARAHLVKKYEDMCLRLFRTKAQPFEERRKHYTLGAKTMQDVLGAASKRPNVGRMLPNLTPAIQELAFWQSIGFLFEKLESEVGVKDDSFLDERACFESAWNELLGNTKSFGISVDMLTPVGAYNGTEARWMVFDISLQSEIFHCYPELSPSQMFQTCIDDLQGLADCLEKG